MSGIKQSCTVHHLGTVRSHGAPAVCSETAAGLIDVPPCHSVLTRHKSSKVLQVSDSLVTAVDMRQSLMHGLKEPDRRNPADTTAIQVGMSLCILLLECPLQSCSLIAS